MGGFWMDNETQDQLNLWLSRISVLLSFGAHVVLALCAEVRRSEDYSVRRGLVWLAYQLTDLAPKAALGQLYLDNSSSEQVLFAFWVPFLLLHLGLADNISAYSLEDNKLSIRKIVELFLQLLAAGYGAYKQKFMSSDRVLSSAFIIMFLLGFYKCVERPVALWLGDLSQLRSSYKGKKAWHFSPDPDDQNGRKDQKLDDDYALLDAHGLLGISMGAFADYGFEKNRMISYSYSDDVVKVVEMELSLMYDIMYTKAAVIHTWPGYIIRFLSPPLTATALLLFHFHSKAGQEEVDIKITYMLLIGTFLLDVRWLLRSLVSTWTYAFLQATECNLLKKTICCRRGRWYVVRRFVFSVDPSRLSISSACLKLNKQISSHRIWSRTIGQHSLLHECTCGTLLNKIGWEGISGIESILKDVCQNLLLQIIFKMDDKDKAEEQRLSEKSYKRRRALDNAMGFGPEFDELVLTWHIATDVFLLSTAGSDESPECKKIKAISNYLMFLVAQHPKMLPGLKLRSHYEDIKHALEIIWKKVDRSHLSGCRQREKRLAEDLRDMLAEEYLERKKKLAAKERRDERAELQRDELSVEVLRVIGDMGDMGEIGDDKLDDMSTMLSEGTRYAKLLELLCQRHDETSKDWETILSEVQLKRESEIRLHILVQDFQDYALEDKIKGWQLEDMLSLILRSWVRLLIFASIRCSRDSHAEQLSRGGELTTVIWILAEHRTRIGYLRQT